MSTYNGWRTRETWLVPLWLEQCPIEKIQAEDKEDAIRQLEAQLEDWFEEVYSEQIPKNGLIADLLGGAIAAIDWREIAEHWIEDVELELSEEDGQE